MHQFDLTRPPDHVLFVTEDHFLSIAIDWALILGERWWEGSGRSARGFGSVSADPIDLAHPTLRRATASLGPTTLRLGGSESDRMAFGDGAVPGGGSGPRPCPSVLSPERWREIAAFAGATGVSLFVTIGAGKCNRDRGGRWNSESFERFAAEVAQAGDPVTVWELGNEVNGFPFIFGPRTRVTAAQYAADYHRFRAISREYTPHARCAGPAAAVWPVLGEPGPLMSAVSRRLGSNLDILSWHYYPFQSRRGRIATRRWKSSIRRQTIARGSARYRAARVRRYARRSGVPAVWLSETGHALFGGEPGRSDRYMDGLWWLDHLGAMAQEGTAGVVRQALVGGDYGLLSTDGFAPRPDYWLSVLWKRTMGPAVYRLTYFDPLLRVYCHSRADGRPGRAWVIINTDTAAEAAIRVPTGADGWIITGDAADTTARINGRVLGSDDQPAGDTIPAAARLPEQIVLPPLAIAFVLTAG
ncbi:MAG: hypothetical protein PF508_04455 [Spirochaeta sp.]|nr:hypothetical protein [Spirochaeta sp.]